MLKTIRELTTVLAAIGRREAEALTRHSRTTVTIPPDVMRALYDNHSARQNIVNRCEFER
jgi:hypothetical protein